MLRQFLHNKQTIIYGLTLAVLLFLLRWIELRYLIFEHAYEIYAGAIAIIFTTLGIWLAIKLTRPKTIIIEKVLKPEFHFNETERERIGISKRELEVLQLMSEGLSNNEIAEKLQNERVANMVMLGAVQQVSGVVGDQTIHDTLVA